MASVDSPTGPPPKRSQSGREDGAVDLVEAELVDAESGEARRAAVAAVDGAVAAHLGEVADPAQQAVGDAGRAPGPAGDLAGARRRRSRTPRMPAARVDDGLEVAGVVVVEPGDQAEAVAQRAGDRARCGWWRRRG